ncbi:hypothetical protein AVEN_207629-1 [Araneus ventricosus]|uniref:Uncharacterized protein n=1 Tax=Araneus ventricosus TaxID=182803 RepID=A0A4Y2JIE5_ARAVE|nr:hypothetical protein AVEN_249381-1 [Araneus ventricosus]GBM89728.1 hypothetical protein AVEN_28403-1 [Araneus ventricosus]GBM89740.1 hypothetical protein AVEN_90555-1 [Araneus ventricosus]GBM89765.1 hypothetical protein AVEN_207629-1 [Araneus ventricosus]
MFYYYMKTDNCCRDEHGSNLYSVVSDDASSIMDDDDEAGDLFASCQLYVDDPEVNTARGVEYDCRSVDVNSTEEELISLMSQNQRRYEAFHCPDPCVVHTLS